MPSVLRNHTTGAIVATDLRVAASFFARFRGLMLRPALGPGEALDLPGDASIHMLFMRFPIDAVFYDRDRCVVRVARRLRPWRGFAFARGAAGVIELAAGAAADVQPGHQLAVESMAE